MALRYLVAEGDTIVVTDTSQFPGSWGIKLGQKGILKCPGVDFSGNRPVFIVEFPIPDCDQCGLYTTEFVGLDEAIERGLYIKEEKQSDHPAL